MAKPPNPAAPEKLAVADRRLMALGLRRQGGSYRQIAGQLSKQPGVSPRYNEAQAFKDVMAALQRLNDKMAEEAAAVRTLELERLDELFAVYYGKAKLGDYAALDRCLHLMDRRARYLGLDAPVRQELTGKDGGPIEHREALMSPAEWWARAEQRRKEAEETLALFDSLSADEGHGDPVDEKGAVPD